MVNDKLTLIDCEDEMIVSVYYQNDNGIKVAVPLIKEIISVIRHGVSGIID
jgi:hypothetical protein